MFCKNVLQFVFIFYTQQKKFAKFRQNFTTK